MRNCKILYIEDDAITNKLISSLLKKHFKDVDCAFNGKSGLEKFFNNHPDILVTDLSLPILNGAQIIDRIKKDEPEFPVIVTTAFDDVIIDYDNVKILTKPIIALKLIDTINNALNIHNKG